MQEKTWTIREVLSWTTNKFKECDLDTPLLDAQLLLSKVLNTQKINLYLDLEKPLTKQEREQLRELVKRRLHGEPVAYILEEKYWYNLKLYVDKRVLIPRPETECLLDFTVETLKKNQKKPTIIFDFCTGSGCLAIALAKLYPDATVVGIDISHDALVVAAKNAELNNVTNTEWMNLDLTQEQSYSILKNKYSYAQVIVANPPYVSEKEFNKLELTVKNYEPKLALLSNDEGLFIGKVILDYIIQYDLLDLKYHILGIEMGVNHPDLLYLSNRHIHDKQNKLKNYKFNSIVQEKNSWFSLCDLDDKNRFLFKYYFYEQA